MPTATSEPLVIPDLNGMARLSDDEVMGCRAAWRRFGAGSMRVGRGRGRDRAAVGT